MHFQFPHKTSKFKATQKVKEALDHARPQLKEHATVTDERWEGEMGAGPHRKAGPSAGEGGGVAENRSSDLSVTKLHFAADLQGKKISGTLQVTDTEFIVDAKLPLVWRLFEGRIEKMIEEQVKQML